MKVLRSIIVCLSFSLLLHTGGKATAQSDYLPLSVWMTETTESFPPGVMQNLENKLLQMASANGISRNTQNARFVLTANVNVLTKDITPTAPPMHAYTLDITFYIGDGVMGEAFANYSSTVRGVGENPTRAYLSALGRIDPNDPAFGSFVETGKNRIIQYYNSQCDLIIKDALTASEMNRFDEALWILTMVPMASAQCYNKSMDNAANVFQKKIDFECQEKLNRATNVWNANQSWQGANEAGEILSGVNPNASCIDGVKSLADRISARILEVDSREWAFNYDYTINLRRDLIGAYRDVGVAFGEGQAQSITYRSFW